MFSQKCYYSCVLIVLSPKKKAAFCGRQLSITLEKAIFGVKCYFGKTHNILERFRDDAKGNKSASKEPMRWRAPYACLIPAQVIWLCACFQRFSDLLLFFKML